MAHLGRQWRRSTVHLSISASALKSPSSPNLEIVTYSYGSITDIKLASHSQTCRLNMGRRETDINDTSSASIQACLDKTIISGQVAGLELATGTVDEELPANWQSEDIHLVIIDEV